MKRIRYHRLAVGTLAVVGLMIIGSIARGDGTTCPGSTPFPNGVQISPRVFNDCPSSALTIVNAYPGSISFSDQVLDCFGGANLHTWTFSSDGGLTKALFENCSMYRFCANVVLDGTGNGEAGLRLSLWYSPDVDGKFMINATSGEIACFGGRLPFYSFTTHFGVTYTKGVNAFMEMIYNPNTLNATLPASIEYHIRLGSGPLLSSGPLYFNEANPSEAALHGVWGELFPAYPGGYFQPQLGQGQIVGMVCTFSDICFDGDPVTPTRNTTWGQLKTLYR